MYVPGPQNYVAEGFVNHNTGVGKGEQIAAIIWDRFRSGQKRAIWFSAAKGLKEDAARDFQGIGADELVNKLVSINDWNAADDINLPEGIIFSTYQSLIAKAKGEQGQTRLDQIKKWLGPNGVIIFDEGHAAKNAVASGEGQALPSKTGENVLKLQEDLPNAYVTYASATAATDVANLGYMTRLGLWGEGTFFHEGFNHFMAEVGNGGIAAMELISRELKAAGKYLSRSISYKGVEFSEKLHELSADQIRTYDAAADAWQLVGDMAQQQMRDNSSWNTDAKAEFDKEYWGRHQPFFRKLLTAMKVPTLLDLTDKALAEDKSVVISLIGTGQAQAEQQLAKAGDSEDDLDFSPREALIKMIRDSYPTILYEEYTDEDGKTRKRPVVRDGKVQQNPEAVEKREGLIKKLSDELQLPDNPLDLIIRTYGRDKVAELTGRKKTVERNAQGKWEYVSRSPKGISQDAVNLHEMEQFQSGKKRIAIISKAAGTGISLHADLTKANQQPRLQIALELSWSADQQLQAFGRTHRSNQKQPPEYIILSTNAGGERRFSSTIARRLESLGALTKGQRDATGGSSVLSKYNFETAQGIQATEAFYTSMLANEISIPGIDDPHEILRQMGILKQPVNAAGEPIGLPSIDKKDIRHVTRLLNRILNVRFAQQNAVYDYFTSIFDSIVQRAIEDGVLDTGVNVVRGDAVRLVDSKVIAKNPTTGAETYRYLVEVERKNSPVPADYVRGLARANKGRMFKRREFKGPEEPDQLAWVQKAGTPITTRDGTVQTAFNMFGPGHREGSSFTRIAEGDLQSNWEPIEGEQNLRELKTQEKTIREYKADLVTYKKNKDDWSVNYYTRRIEELEKSVENLKKEVEEARAKQFELWQQAHDASPLARVEQIHMIGGSVIGIWGYLHVGSGRMDIRIAYPDTGGSITGVVMREGDANAVERSLTGQAVQRGPTSIFDAVINGRESFTLQGGTRLTQGRINRQPVIDVVSRDYHVQNFLDSIGIKKERVSWNWKWYIPNDQAKGVAIIERLLAQYPLVDLNPPERDPRAGYINASILTAPLQAAEQAVRHAFNPNDVYTKVASPKETARLVKGGLRNALAALKTADDEHVAVKFGEKLRTLVTGTRDWAIATANQLRDRLRKQLPNPVDQEALTLYRDFNSRPGEMQQFANGTHQYIASLQLDPQEHAAMMAKMAKLQPVIDRALNPTPEILRANDELTKYFGERLKEGKRLGFLNSSISNEDYITHFLQPDEGDVKKAIEGQLYGGKFGPKRFRFNTQRRYPTVLHALAAGLPPRTLNALDAVSVYGDRFGTTAAYWMFRRAVRKTGMGKFGNYADQRSGKIPATWVPINPGNRNFQADFAFIDSDGNARHHSTMLFVPQSVEMAMRPIIDPNYMARLKAFQQGRMGQAYIKMIQLGMSVFHLRALNIAALGNMNANGLIASYMSDLNSPEFQAAERFWVRNGLTTPILDRQVEVYRALNPSSLPTRAEQLRSTPGIKQLDKLASGISHVTFGIVQRRNKVIDASMQYAAWMAKNPNATPQQAAEATRQIAKEVNATYGGLHWENLGFQRMGVEIAKFLLLAPDWLFSNYFNLKYAFEKGPAGNAARWFVIRSLLWGLGLTAAATYLFTRHASKDPNPVKRYTNVVLGEDQDGKALEAPMFFAGLPSDMLTMINDVAQRGAVLGLGQFMAGRLGPLPKTAIRVGEGRNAFGQKLYPADANFLEKTWAGAKEAAGDIAPLPFSVVTLAKMAKQDFTREKHHSPGEYVAAALAGRQPVGVGTPAEEVLSNFFRENSSGQQGKEQSQIRSQITAAIRRGDDDRALKLMEDGMNAGKITLKDIENATNRAKMTRIEADFKTSELPPEVAIEAYAKANPDEKALLMPILNKRLDEWMKKLPPVQQQAILDKMERAGM
jgi:hypothetical protein